MGYTVSSTNSPSHATKTTYGMALCAGSQKDVGLVYFCLCLHTSSGVSVFAAFTVAIVNSSRSNVLKFFIVFVLMYLLITLLSVVQFL